MLVTSPSVSHQSQSASHSLLKCLVTCKNKQNCFSLVYDQQSKQCKIYKETVSTLNVNIESYDERKTGLIIASVPDINVSRHAVTVTT